MKPFIIPTFLLATAISKGAWGDEVAVSADGAVESAPVSGPLGCVLHNDLDRDVDVYWVENAAKEVLVVPNLRAGTSTKMSSYVGHGFFFSEKGQGRDGILQTVIMRGGILDYRVTEESIAASPFRALTVEGSDENACADRKPYCALSADRGECEANPGWMIINCPRSCDGRAAYESALAASFH